MNSSTVQKLSTSSIIMATIFTLASCSGNENSTAGSQKKETVPVVVATPSSGSTSRAVIASGRIESMQTANISTRIMGSIISMNAEVGDRVRKGQVLATISAQDIRAKKAQTDAMVTEAEFALKNAQKDFERYTNLYNQQSATAKELDNITLQYQSMQAKTEAARQMRNEVNAMLRYTTLVAPFSGYVTRKNSSVGDMASPGMPLYVVEQDKGYQVSATIPETDINRISIGLPVAIQLKSTGRTIQGKISEINPSSQFSGGQYIVKVSIPENENKGLNAGMYAHINIETEQQIPSVNAPGERILIPSKSIIWNDQLTGLYTVSSSNTALLRWVKLGKTYGDEVEVLAGLGRNEEYILSSRGRLYNGAPLAITRN